MKTNFYAKISQISKTGKYTIEIPGFPAEVAPENPEFAATKVAAIQRATELLEGIFLNCISNSEPIPSQNVNSTAGLESITINSALAFALWLRGERTKKNLSQAQAAKILSISTPNYQHLELAKRCNPTLRTILKILDCFELESITIPGAQKK